MGSNLTITQRLDEQLQSCCMPQHDPIKSTPDELIRDLHRVITGNGAFNKGLLFKVALANANIGELSDKVTTLDSKLEVQVTTCKEVQAANAAARARKEGERFTIQKLGEAVWSNKQLVMMLIMLILIAVLGAFGFTSTVADLDTKINQINKLLPGK